MGDVLKIIAAAILVGAVVKYAAHEFTNKAMANPEWSTSEFEFETGPMEFPEPTFNFNTD